MSERLLQTPTDRFCGQGKFRRKRKRGGAENETKCDEDREIPGRKFVTGAWKIRRSEIPGKKFVAGALKNLKFEHPKMSTSLDSQ